MRVRLLKEASKTYPKRRDGRATIRHVRRNPTLPLFWQHLYKIIPTHYQPRWIDGPTSDRSKTNGFTELTGLLRQAPLYMRYTCQLFSSSEQFSCFLLGKEMVQAGPNHLGRARPRRWKHRGTTQPAGSGLVWQRVGTA